jgi:uncharacterized membrane-anchored protein YhcB (DUF1043 family)
VERTQATIEANKGCESSIVGIVLSKEEIKMNEQIKKRAVETVQKRLRGSFGFRAAESVTNGFKATENLTVYKAHEGTKDELPRLLDLAIERTKPQVTVEEYAKRMGVTDIGEAQAILDEQSEEYDEHVKNKAKMLKDLEAEFDAAPSKYKELSQYAGDNYKRVLQNVQQDARKQFIRSGKEDWAKAIEAAVTPLLTAVVKLAA